jgi:cyclic dehypoxanthinyl futalosine synthase
VLVRILLPQAEHVPLGADADAKLLIGDAALQSMFEDPTPHYDLGRLWQERTGLPMVYAVFACADPPPQGIREVEEALLESHRLSRAEPEALAREASARYGYPAGFLARYFEKLRYGFGPRERAGLLSFFELAREAGELAAVPELRFVPSQAEDARLPRTAGRADREVGVRPILDKALDGERISDGDALTLLRSKDLVAIGKAADELRARKTDASRVTFIVDRNVNYTNICHTDCDFCAFYRRPGDRAEGYLLPKQVIFKKIEETLALGGTGLLMQGGHHPDLGIDYYEDLFRSIKSRYRIHLHALSPPEVHHISRRSKLTIPETLTRLRDAGLDSIPGGGGEILVDRVRRIIAPKKTKSAEWLGVMREAHRLGISTTATMMYGHVETLEERVEHMRKIRDLQDEQHGFRAFISWTFQPEGTRLAPKVTHHPTSLTYLLTQAVSRIYLDNVDHIQSSWVTQGMKVGQVALSFGADDLGSVMIEENVVSAAGTTHRASTDDFVRTIRALGKIPVQRDTLYREVRVFD